MNYYLFKLVKIIVIIGLAYSQIVFADIFDICKKPEMIEYYQKKERMYDREGYLASCDDTLNTPKRELNPCLRGGGPTNHYYFDLQVYPPYDNFYKGIESINGKVRKREETHIYLYDSGEIERIRKIIDCGGFNEYIIIQYDSKGNLVQSEYTARKDREIISSRIEVWNKGKMVRTKYENVPRSIVQGKTPCDIEVHEPRGKVVSLHLNLKNELTSLTYKKTMDSSDVSNTIKYHWYQHCKDYHETYFPIRK